MDITKAAIIEFLLFASPTPLSVSQLKEMIEDIDTVQIEESINWLKENFYHSGRALQICEISDGYQICTRQEFHPWLKKFSNYQMRRRLSLSALEVLSIIAYRQPITRNEIDEIRGVNSTLVIKNLLKQKLVRIHSRKDCPGRPIQYCIGNNFLTYFGLKNINELPKETELKELIANENTQG